MANPSPSPPIQVPVFTKNTDSGEMVLSDVWLAWFIHIGIKAEQHASEYWLDR